MNEFKFASVGLNTEHVRFFQQLLKLYIPKNDKLQTPKLNDRWLYIGNFDAQDAVFSMGTGFSDADILFIDMDNEYGKRAWYTLEVFFDEDKMIALTSNLQYSGSKYFIQKTTLNWLSGQGVNVVSVLNTLSPTTE